MATRLFISAYVFFMACWQVSGQQDAYSRDNSGTDLWWNDSQQPWYYVNWGNQNRPDNWPIPTRNYLFIGHNVNTTMRVNGAYFGIASLTIQPSASSARTYNAIDNGGIGLTLGIFNNSGALQTFNVPIRVDADNVKLSAINGPMTFNGPIYTEGRALEFTDGNTITVNGVIQQGGAITKKGTGTVSLKVNNTYTGHTTVEAGILILDATGGALPPTNNVTVNNTGILRVSKNQVLNNLSVLNTGAIVVDAGVTLTINGTLTLTAVNSITLGAGASLQYGSSSTLLYNPGSNITVSAIEWPAVNGPASVTVNSGTVTASMNRTLTGNLTINGGMLDLGTYTLNRVIEGGSFTMADGTTLKIGGENSFPLNYAAYSLNTGSTTEYNGSTQQIAVFPSGEKYGHLVLSGSAVKMLGGNVHIAGNLTVNTVSLNVTSGQTLTVESNIINNGGTVTFANNANLLQGAATTLNNNTGNVIVNRETSPIYRNDYTMWSAPVAAQNLFGFSPNTLAERFYTYNTTTNFYNAITGLGPASTTIFEPGRGYLIRMPNAAVVGGIPTGTTADVDGYNAGNAVMTFTGSFTGVPNNGTVTVALNTDGSGYNLVGNPYPSPLNLEAFRAGNTDAITGSLWIWRKKSQPTNPNTAYITINSVGVYVGNGEPGQEDPNGILRTGQGFIVQVKPGFTTSNLVFANNMRSNDTANQFFRMTPPEAHGIWLNLTSAGGIFSQMYTGYIEGATNGEDRGLDAKFIGDSPTVLAAFINNKAHTIEARALPFTQQDVVRLMLRAATAGTYSLAIDHTNGLFANGQDIYLRDNLTAQLHHLNQGSYSFITDAGTFADRFDIVFTPDAALSTGNTTAAPESVIVYADGALHIESTATLTKTEVFDLGGRLLYSNAGPLGKADVITSILRQKQVLLVRVDTVNGTVIKKVIY